MDDLGNTQHNRGSHWQQSRLVPSTPNHVLPYLVDVKERKGKTKTKIKAGAIAIPKISRHPNPFEMPVDFLSTTKIHPPRGKLELDTYGRHYAIQISNNPDHHFFGLDGLYHLTEEEVTKLIQDAVSSRLFPYLNP